MTDKIREKFRTEDILGKALSIAREKAGGEIVFVKSGTLNVIESTMEEVYLMGWRDAMAQEETQSELFRPHAISRDRITKPLKEGEIDREAIENAKDIKKLDNPYSDFQRGCISNYNRREYGR